MKILVTGINGFVGKHVARCAYEAGIQVIGTGMQPIIEQDIHQFVSQYYVADLVDPFSVKKIDLSDVHSIINLAGYASVRASKGKLEEYIRVNVGVHTVLYEECLRQGVSPRIIAVSSGAVYDPRQPMPLNEISDLIPEQHANEYAISKLRMEQALDAYRQKGLEIIVVRPFNHSGPGQQPGFLLPDLGEQIFRTFQTGRPILVGSLDTKRDYSDVRDVARAYVMLSSAAPGSLNHTTYNVCSGRSHSGKELLQLVTQALDIQEVQIETDKTRTRSNEVMDIYGSAQRLQEDTGWRPEISFEKMVVDFIDWKKSQASTAKS